jgi:hypothetical protein
MPTAAFSTQREHRGPPFTLPPSTYHNHYPSPASLANTICTLLAPAARHHVQTHAKQEKGLHNHPSIVFIWFSVVIVVRSHHSPLHLVEVLGVGQHFVHGLPAGVTLVRGDDKLLHLFKLVDAEDAKRVASVAARLLAEARRVAHIPERTEGGGRKAERVGWGCKGIVPENGGPDTVLVLLQFERGQALACSLTMGLRGALSQLMMSWAPADLLGWPPPSNGKQNPPFMPFLPPLHYSSHLTGRSCFSNQSLRCMAHSVCSLVAIRYLSSPSPASDGIARSLRHRPRYQEDRNGCNATQT